MHFGSNYCTLKSTIKPDDRCELESDKQYCKPVTPMTKKCSHRIKSLLLLNQPTADCTVLRL